MPDEEPPEGWTATAIFPVDGEDQAAAAEAFHQFMEAKGIQDYRITLVVPRQSPGDSFGGRNEPPPPPYPPEAP